MPVDRRNQGLGGSRKASGQPSPTIRPKRKPATGDSPTGSGKGIDLNAARQFLSALDPEADGLTFQTIPEAPNAKGKPQIIVGAFNDVADKLVRFNERGHGVFVTVQRMDGGGRKAGNLAGIRACFADIDGRAGGKLPKKWPLPPSVLIETSPGSFHAWWFPADEPSLELWQGLQRSIVGTLQSDPAGKCDVAKLLRLPGFLHQKAEPHRVEIVSHCPARYGLIEMQAAFPPVEAKRPHQSHGSVHSASVGVAVLKSALDHLARTPHPDHKRSKSYSDGYEAWVKFGLAIHRALGDDGFDLWDDWSRSSDRYCGEEASRRKWESFASAESYGGDQVSVGSIFYTAKRHGWSYANAQVRSAFQNALTKFNKQAIGENGQAQVGR